MIPIQALARLFANAGQNNNFRDGNVGGQFMGQVGGNGGSPYVGGFYGEDPYLDVGGNGDDPYVGGPIRAALANVRGRVEARRDGRQASALGRIQSRHPQLGASQASTADGSPDDAMGAGFDGGQVFESANLGGLWKRTGIILECPMNTAQTLVAAGGSLAMSVEPERELEIMGFELSVEGGATNIEYQETQRASYGITLLAVGQDSMRGSSGEGAGTLLSSDKASFRGFVAKSGRNINLTLKNNGVASSINVSAITQYVTPVR